jgi:DNA-binding CsgD family transcriptional regulator
VTRLRSSDFEAMLAFVGEAQAVEGPEPFTSDLLVQLGALVSCELVSFEEVNLVERVLHARVSSINRSVFSPTDIESLSDEAWALMSASPVAVYRARTGDFGMAKWSDLFGRRQRLRHDVQPGLCHVELASVWLAPSLVHKISLNFSSDERDFTERDRLVINVLRPHFIALYRAAGVRRFLAAALAGLERSSDDEGRGVLLRGRDGSLDFASPKATALLTAYFGASGARLPPELETWIELQAKRPDRSTTAPASPFAVARNGHRLVVNAAGPGLSVLLLHEEAAPVAALTPREWDVMRCVAAGKSNTEIGTFLWIAPTTVRKHLENIYEKLGVHSRTAAVSTLRLHVPNDPLLDMLDQAVPAAQA